MDKPEENYWRIHDTLKLFLKVDPDYVTQLLKVNPNIHKKKTLENSKGLIFIIRKNTKRVTN